MHCLNTLQSLTADAAFSSSLRKKIFFLAFFTIMLCLILSLSGCRLIGSRHVRDGAPKRRVNLSLLRNAVPRIEPLSRYGNRFKKGNSYVAKNRRYQVMHTSRGYKQRGLASWYGTKFHGRRTSSGEPYNMFAMTGAHRTLPLPTYAKVTHLKTGKWIIVKINDRGPFHKKRLLDLSYAAAVKLGATGAGTVPVEIESIDPRDNPHLRTKYRRLALR